MLEPDLLERLVADAGNEPGALPLLQEALVRLWGTMRLHRISLAAYESIGGDGRGGLSAAVADTADAALATLSPGPGARSPSACSSGSSSSGRAGPTRAASSGSRTSAARATTTRRSSACSTFSPARGS